jgi:hypothetical protein
MIGSRGVAWRPNGKGFLLTNNARGGGKDASKLDEALARSLLG